MKSLQQLGLAVALGLSAASIQAGIISGELYNTGLDVSGNLVAASGGTDGNWEVNPPGENAITYKHPAYAANDSDSQWISSNVRGGDETTSSTDYVFSTTFDLSGYDASTASITGLWGVDNYASIYLNGNDTGVALPFGSASFSSLHGFSISDYFVDGINVLTVNLTNGYVNDPNRDPGPMALRFDDLQLSATAVPEPGTLALLGLGIAGLGWARRKQS